VLLLIYPDFPLAEVDLSRRTQRVWSTPEAVHGARPISAIGRTIFFHGSHADWTAVHAWRRGSKEATRISSFAAPLNGLAAGWFLARSYGQVARVRFEAPGGGTVRFSLARASSPVAQRSCASLRFDERNRLGLGHRLAAVLAVRTGQCRGQLEPDNLTANDGRRIRPPHLSL
jgi:hypothetical protein